MKKYYVPLLLMLLALPLLYIGCRDRIERDIVGEGYILDSSKFTTPTVPQHCSDGILDSGEMHIDCGGTCPACTNVTPSCNIGTDSIVYYSAPSGYSAPINQISSITASYNTVYSKWEFAGFSSTGDQIYIGIFATNPPDLTRSYSISAMEAIVNVTPWSFGLNIIPLSSGTVYLTKNSNGKYVATVCDGIDYSVWISSQSNYYNFYFTMNITQP